MKTIFKALGALAIGALLPITSASAEPLGATYDEILAGAKKEGQLSVWAYLPSRSATHSLVIEAFNKRFDLSTELEWVPMAAPTANTRVFAEAAGRQISVDIIGGGSIGEVVAASEAGVISPYDWGGVFGAEIPGIKVVEDIIIPELRGTALTYMELHYVIGWNPEFIKDEDVPNTIEEMTDPKWKGKIGLNAFFLVPLDVLSFGIGSEAAEALADRLILNTPVLSKGSGAVNQSITSGQVPYGITLSIMADRSARNNEPLKSKMFSDYILASDILLWVPDNSPNPNTARLFAAWFAAEGYKVANELESIPSALDADNIYRKMADKQVAATGAKILKLKDLAEATQMGEVRAAITLKLNGQ